MWNNLPDNIKFIKSLNSLKSKLKTFIMTGQMYRDNMCYLIEMCMDKCYMSEIHLNVKHFGVKLDNHLT